MELKMEAVERVEPQVVVYTTLVVEAVNMHRAMMEAEVEVG